MFVIFHKPLSLWIWITLDKSLYFLTHFGLQERPRTRRKHLLLSRKKGDQKYRQAERERERAAERGRERNRDQKREIFFLGPQRMPLNALFLLPIPKEEELEEERRFNALEFYPSASFLLTCQLPSFRNFLLICELLWNFVFY
jgi:hypothetical protein